MSKVIFPSKLAKRSVRLDTGDGKYSVSNPVVNECNMLNEQNITERSPLPALNSKPALYTLCLNKFTLFIFVITLQTVNQFKQHLAEK